jgi:hypothetical protein
MNIKNVDALKVWLSSRLEPICDADPASLAKYILALLKKNKSEDALKELCVDQLEVFLSNETTRFVELLFNVLKSEAYLPMGPRQSDIASLPPYGPQLTSYLDSAPKVLASPTITRKSAEDFSGQDSVVDEDDRDFKRTKRTTTGISVSPGYRHPQEVESLASVASGISDTLVHCRPTSPISTISTISTSRVREREREHISYRRRVEEEPRRSSRRHHEDEIRIHRHGDMVEFGQRRRGNVYERLGHRPEGRREESHLVPVLMMRSDHDRMDSADGLKDDKSEQTTTEETSKRQQLCPDYEDKGFCYHGDLCPYSHGSDAVVFDERGGISRPGNAFRPHVRHRGAVAGQQMPPQPPHPMMPIADHFGGNGYNPEAPSYDGQQLPPPPPPPPMPWGVPPLHLPPPGRPFGPRFGFPPHPVGAIPRFDHKQSRAVEKSSSAHDGSGQDPEHIVGSRKSDSESNHWPKGPSASKFSDTLLLRRVPRHLNNISKINAHFQKFGSIMNIQVGALGDQEAALLQFSSHAEAKRAHDCPEAVFNNRFIRVYWHKDEMETGTIKNVGTSQESKQQQIPQRKQPGHQDAVPSTTTTSLASQVAKPTQTRTLPSPGALSFNKLKSAQPPVSSVCSSGKPSKVAVQKSLELQKQKQALMAKQIEQQKLLIGKLENSDKLSAEERATLMKTLKSLSAGISSLQQSASSGTSALQQAASLSEPPRKKVAIDTVGEGA